MPVVDLASLASFLGPVGGRVTLIVVVGALMLRRVAEQAIRRRLGEARARGEGGLAEMELSNRVFVRTASSAAGPRRSP